MLVAALCGSLRPGSYNRALLRAASEELPRRARLELVDGLAELPFYDEDLDAESTPAAAVALRETLAAADAVLIATPEYNGAMPAVLKNALDWASRPFPDNCTRDNPTPLPNPAKSNRAASLKKRPRGFDGVPIQTRSLSLRVPLTRHGATQVRA